MRSFSLLSKVALVHIVAAVQVIGPVANLPISNKVLAPDGVSRNTIVAGGAFPGPIITGSPVRIPHSAQRWTRF
jgi:iron transport multicopper oxidase